MSDIALFGADPVNGRSKWNILDHTGPTSYVQGGESWPQQSSFGGPNSAGLSGIHKIDSGVSNSGNYRVDANYVGAGVRATVKLVWKYTGMSQAAGTLGVNAVAVVLGTTPTNGTYTITATAGVGQIQVVVAGGVITTMKILNPGAYTAAPTFTPPAGLGTGATITAQIGNISGLEVAPGTVLTGETVRLLVIGG